MDTDENFKHQESEPGFDKEKRNRRSSILKPRKSVICPIDESNTEVCTSGKASRRVSFANINFIKPFASDPEKTTIWDNTYEEEVNHSDSTKSVDTVCPGLLNVTSISFPEFEDKESVGKAPFQIWESASSSKYIHYEIAPGVKECDKENVIPLVETIVPKNETIIFDRTDSDIEFTGSYANVNFKVPKSIVEFVKNRPSQNKSIASNRTGFEMELTSSVPNTVVVRRAENSCENISRSPNEAKNGTICPTDDMEFTLATDNSFSNNMEFTTIVGDVKSSSTNEPCSNIKEKDFRPLSQNSTSYKIGFAMAEQIDDMEFTTNLYDVKQGLQNHKVMEPNIPEAKMEFTCNLTNFNKFLTLEQDTRKEKIQSVVGNDSEEADMEFTTNLAVPQYFSSATALSKQPSVDNASDDQMEYTTNLPNIKQMYGRPDFANEYFSDHSVQNPQQSVISKIIQAPTENICEEIDMEFTTNLTKAKYFSSAIQTALAKTYHSNQLEKNEQHEQIECSVALKSTKQVYQHSEEHKSEEIDMEFTTNLALNKYSNGIQSHTAVTDHSKHLETRNPEVLLERTTNFTKISETYNHPGKPNSEEIDMEFTTNLEIYKQSSNVIPPIRPKSIIYNQLSVEGESEDMECTTIVPNAKQISYNLHDLPSGNTSQGNCTETVQPAVKNYSEGVDKEFTISSAESKCSLNSANSIQRFGEVKYEDIKQVHNHSKEILSSDTSLEPSSNVPNIDGQAVDSNESRALDSKVTDDSTASKEVSGVGQTTITEVVGLCSSNLPTEQPSRGPEVERSALQTTVKRNNGDIGYKKDCGQLNPSKHRTVALGNLLSDKDNTGEVLETPNHKQVEDKGIDEFTNRGDSNILYSEQGNLLLKLDEYLPVFGNNAATPTTSFAMNFSNMSPCIEDTQQLIHATFSKPESIDVLLTGRTLQIKNINENKSDSKDSNFISQLNDTSDNFKKISAEAINQDTKTNKTCWDLANSSNDKISNTTPEIVDVDESISIEEEVMTNKEDSSVKMEGLEVSLESTRDSLDYQNYTIRSNRILNDIKKHLVYMQPDSFFEESTRRCEKVCDQYLGSKAWIKSFVENYRLPKINVVDLEHYFKGDSEDSSTSRMSEGLSNDESDSQKLLSMPYLALPKPLYERVCEAAGRSGKYWHFVKSENDFYHFNGLFGAISFKAHIHPELGIVHSVETRNKLAEESSPLAHYEAKVFELKLKQENLLLALGPKFDIFSLLDYVCLCMDEIASFHKEFHQLLNKYGSSHKLTVHRDNRVTFEILHFHFIIWWTITIEMSVNNLGCKECISAKYNLKEKVDEEDVKQIAENCPKGLNFLRYFIEKVDEYVQRIGKRIACQRESRLKYMNC